MSKNQSESNQLTQRKLIIGDLYKTIWVSLVILGLLGLAFFNFK